MTATTDTYLRRTTTSAETGTTVELYDARDPESVFDEVGGRWVTICVDHGDVVNHPTLDLANRWLRHSETWCVACADEWVEGAKRVDEIVVEAIEVEAYCDCGERIADATDVLCDACDDRALAEFASATDAVVTDVDDRRAERISAAIAVAVDNIRRAQGRTAAAAKRGTNAQFPFVPLVTYTDGSGTRRTENPARRRAFATREEALAFAQDCIDRAYQHLAERLLDPTSRALREQHGLSRDLDSVAR